MATYWENSCPFGLRYVSWYKYLIVSLVFSHLGFWSGNLFLIAPFPDLCLLVPFHLNTNHNPMSRVMRKPDFGLCENKGADQLHSNCEADQRLCFRYTDSTIPLLRNFQPLAISCAGAAWILLDLVGNPEDWFSCVAAPIIQVLYKIHHIPRAHPPHKLFGPCPLEPKEIDGQLVSPGKAYTLLTNHLITG